MPATGRSFGSVPEMIREYPGVEYLITANGGAVYSVSEKKRIYQCLMTPESVEVAIAVRKREKMVMEVVVDGVPYAEEAYVRDPIRYLATEYGARYIKATRTPVKDIIEFAAAACERTGQHLLRMSAMRTRNRLYTSLEKEIPDIYVTSSVSNLLEMGHKDAGKGKDSICGFWINSEISPEEAMAFGDADNDSSMLEVSKIRHRNGKCHRKLQEIRRLA